MAESSRFGIEHSASPQPGNSADPADGLTFVAPSNAQVQRFDTRPDRELVEVARDHEVPAERERALWELADRIHADALQSISEVWIADDRPELRWSALWAAQRYCGNHAERILRVAQNDEHPEVRDWASMLLRELRGLLTPPAEPIREMQVSESDPFDQTLPLMIAGHARVYMDGVGWIQATLSPLWFESIMGRVMACTRSETFDRDLVIEKKLSGLHSDGTDHYEIYRFKGFTQKINQSVSHHIYEGEGSHTFYPSGKVEDPSNGAHSDVLTTLARAAVTIKIPISPTVIRRAGEQVVESVRGRYYGVAYVNVARLLAKGTLSIGAGEVQLSNHHHPVAGPLTNTYLFGSFKGKLSDLDGDGLLDVNTEPCHATVAGALDYRIAGHPNPDPFDVCANH